MIAGKTARGGTHVAAGDIARARSHGATDLEIHDTVLIAAAFCMFNRYVDGLATWAPDDPDFYRRARQSDRRARLHVCYLRSHPMNSRFVACCLVVMWSFAATAVFAQDPTGAIEGVVTDPSGAVIANARVLARHLGTGLTRETTSSGTGLYRLVSLPVGSYSVAINAPQLAETTRQPVTVTVNDTVRLNVQLGLSTVTEERHRCRRAQLVDAATTALGRVVTGRELVDLPLNGGTSRSLACCRRAWRR